MGNSPAQPCQQLLALAGEGTADILPREAPRWCWQAQGREGTRCPAPPVCRVGAVLGAFQDFYLLNHTARC